MFAASLSFHLGSELPDIPEYADVSALGCSLAVVLRFL
jgi:hypothetical protein